MSPDERIRQLLADWPTLYCDRAQALQQLLASNSYEWQDGVLAFRGGEEDYRWDVAQARQSREFPISDDPEVLFAAARYRDAQLRQRTGPESSSPLVDEFLTAGWRQQAIQEAAQTAHVWKNLDRLSREHAALEEVRRPHERAALTNIPDDITDEWLLAVEEFADLVLAATTVKGCAAQRTPQAAAQQLAACHALARAAKERSVAVRASRQAS